MLTHQIVEQLDGQARLAAKRGDADAHEIAEIVGEIRRKILGAVQFDAGNAAELLTFHHAAWDQARPPFPVTIVQFRLNSEHNPYLLSLWDEDSVEKFMVYSWVYDNRLDHWFPMITQTVTWSRGSLEIVADSQSVAVASELGYQTGSPVWGTCVTQCLLFFSILACSNVEKRPTHILPERNARRARQGKLPLFDYWTLHINLARPAADEKPYQGGTHASPRVHLRRGHIRRLESGKTVWVQSCVVGWRPDKSGGILKDYAVMHGSGSTTQNQQAVSAGTVD